MGAMEPVTRIRRPPSMATTSLTPGSKEKTEAATGAAKRSSTSWYARSRTFADDGHPVAGLLDLVEDVGREERRAPLGDGLAEEPEERLLHERVEPGGRLVEDEQVGPVLECDDQPDLLLVALGVLLEAARRVEVEAGDEVGLVERVDVAAKVREVLDRLLAREPVEQGELAGQVADAPMDGHRVGRRLDPEHARAPRGRAEEVQEEADSGGLPGAVRPEEAEDLALLHAEVHVDDTQVGSVELGELLGLDDGHRAASGGC
jgi:hypothetical protein